jgi:hypothetical protein
VRTPGAQRSRLQQQIQVMSGNLNFTYLRSSFSSTRTTIPTTRTVCPSLWTRNYGSRGKQSTTYYDHFDLLKTLETGFSLPCLNNACNATAQLIDLFDR